MTVQFVDTHYLLALVNVSDEDHLAAVQQSRGRVGRLVTTTWILVEFADALSAVASRIRAVKFIRGFEAEAFVEVVPPTGEQFRRALDRYEQRTDKSWSLTDCISFLVMEDLGVTDALTADRHFEQAGFRALLRKA
jgi:predicted nucleic acid-binding protein